ncbi:MAG: 1-acyl-sn-glycerol-3-phosphate acyltransferase [Pirellulales bacterium]|nr:1-acyl-sn-glycerol-3-phosphate acyltransferase [Pirellulales bacterium]
MQNIVIDKPYRFIPPHAGTFWPRLLHLYGRRYLDKNYGLERFEFRGLERLQASIAAGHGIMLAANHCRPCDPMVLGFMAGRIHCYPHIMASWHLFMQGGMTSWLLPRIGTFSVYREGLDRESLKCAIDLLARAQRPLMIFPEGFVSRTNDRLNNLMEGTAFIARNAAKRRAEATPPGKVVIHPAAVRYFFQGDLDRALSQVLEDIEHRLSWQSQKHLPLVERIAKAGSALLTLKELEYLEKPQSGTMAERLAPLIDRLLLPLEREWLKGEREGDVPSRVKSLRAAILPQMIGGEIDERERARRWRQLADVYLAQQLSLYPPGYFDSPPAREQLLETVERFEEDLTDAARIHRPFQVVVEVGEAIEVGPTRQRGAESDPIMVQLRDALERMLAESKARGNVETASRGVYPLGKNRQTRSHFQPRG